MVYLSLGSNIGKRLKNLQTAIKLLKENGFNVIKTSSIYETSAWPIRSPQQGCGSSDITSELTSNGLKGVTEQPNFLNLVLKGKTKLCPEELLKEIKQIEKEIGRKPTKKWGPRIIDIDILCYDKKILKSNVLTIPHPQLHKRAFVLIPLKEIAPRLVHPVFKKTASQMLKGSSDKGCVVLYNEYKVSGHQEIRMKNIRESGYQEKPVAGFEKLWIWQKAYKFMLEIHKFCKTLPREEKFKLRDQIERSSSSVCDNIAEGYTSYYYKEKIKGFNVARKESGETQNQVRQLSGKGYLHPKESQQWVEEYEEIIRGINGYIRYIREKKGAKRQSYKPDILFP